MIEAIIIFGAISGGTLALLALGFTLIYGVSGVVNMAHGAFFMLGAYMFFAFGPLGFLKLDLLPALILATIFVGIVGSIVYRLIIHPVIKEAISLLVITVGVSLIFQQLILLGFGPKFKAVPSLVPGFRIIWGVKVINARILAFVVSLVLFIGFWIFIKKSKIGGAMRAAAQDLEVAMLMGINTERLFMLTMALSASLAAIAGIFITASTTGVAYPFMWLEPLFTSFAIVILGGLGSVKGTLIGAFIIGYAENTVFYLTPAGSYLKGAVGLTVMVLVLLLRPRGIFGKRIELEE